jgi:hypothetical protein
MSGQEEGQKPMNADDKQPTAPPAFDNTQAFREGWGLFECDDNVLRIQRLDDPQSVDPSYPTEPVFLGDRPALEFVDMRRREGSAYHAAAMALHNTEG